jgi:hypothetical protein
MSFICKASTVAWPLGLAYVIVKELFKRFMPQDLMAKVELRKRLNRVTMKANDNPSAIFEMLSTIQNRYNAGGRPISEDDLIAVIISAAPKQYQAVITGEQMRLGNTLTVEALNNVMQTPLEVNQ